MSDLQTIWDEILQLSPDELETLRQRIEAYQHENPAARVAALRAGLEAFREGLSPEELQAITDAMNYEYVNPKDLKQFEWIDDLPEDQR